MNSQEFTLAVRENTRLYEAKLHSCEARTAEASGSEIALEQRIAALLRQVAELHLQDSAAQASEVARELELRADEEQLLRAELDAIGHEIDGYMADIRSQSAALKAAMSQPASRAADYLAAQQALESARAEQAAFEETEPELRAEIAAKLPAYGEEPLYAWLREIGYGTAAYGRTGAAAQQDSTIARLCHFEENRRNEHMLLAMQAAMPDRAMRLQRKVEEARAALAALESPTTAAERIARQLAPLEAAIARAEARARRVEAILSDYASRRDPRYRKAQELLLASLESQSLDQLVTRARATASPEDDKLAMEIVDLSGRLAACRRDYQRALAARHHAAADLRRATALEQALREGRWFDGVEYAAALEMPRLLARYMNEGLALDPVVATVQRNAVRRVAYRESSWGHGN